MHDMRPARVAAAHTWDVATIWAVRQMHVKFTISHEMSERWAVEVMEEVHRKCVRELAEMASAYAVEIEGRDVTLTRIGEDMAGIDYRAQWRPDVRLVVLRGGEQDGTELEVRDPFDTLCVARANTAAWLREDAPTELTIIKDTYALAGWSERSRVWVLECR